MKRLLVSVSAITLVVCGGATAHAAAGADEAQGGGASDSAAQNEVAIGEIIVTAQKRSERLNDVPMSISAASGADLARLGVTEPAQLEKIVPGFTYQTSNFGLPIYGMRGVSFSDTSASASPAVSIYVDQVPLPLAVLARGAALDLERVEVLKGPQGTLFGQNATGGAINYIAAKPTDTLKFGGGLTVGRFGQVDLDGHVSGPLSDTVRVRLAGRTEQRGNWQNSTTHDGRNGERDLSMARLLVDWTPTDTLSFELNLNAWRDRSDTQAAQFVRFAPLTPPPFDYAPATAALTAYGPVPRTARAADWDMGLDLARDDRFYQASLRADWAFGADVTLTSISSYIDFKQDSPYDPDGTSYLDLQGRIVADIEIVNQELRLAGTAGPLKWMVGGSYEHGKFNEQNPSFSTATNAATLGIPVFGFRLENNQRVSTKGVFGSLDYDLTPNLTIQASARYTDQKRRFAGCLYDLGTGDLSAAISFLSTILTGQPQAIPPGGCSVLEAATSPTPFVPVSGQVRVPLNEDNASWRGGINWKVNPDTLLYANVTKGYKSGSFSSLPMLTSDQATPVTQESVLAYEAGFKATLLNGQMQANGAVFNYDYKNKQINGFELIVPYGALPALINVPKSSIRGAELALNWRPTSILTLSASGTYVDSKVKTDFQTFDPFGSMVNIKGEQLPNAPKWQLTGDAEFNFPVSDSLDAFLGSTVSYRSSSFAAFGENPEFQLSGYALLDLRAGVRDPDGRWRLQVWGRNVANKYYSQSAAHVVDTVIRYAGMPATYGVTVAVSY